MAAKKKKNLVRMISSQGTGVFFVAKGIKGKKLELRKYDKKARCHVVFKEAKMK